MTDASNSIPNDEQSLWFAEQSHSGFLVALWLDSSTAEKLALAEGEPADSLHITLAYCGDASEVDELTQARVITSVYNEISYTDPLEGKIAGYGRFKGSTTSDGQDVYYLTPDIPRLFDVRQCIIECLRCNGVVVSNSHGYTPHITLAYLDSGAENPSGEIPELDLKFDGVSVVSGSRRVDIPFYRKDELATTISMSESGELPPTAPLGSHPARALYFGSFDKEWIPFLPKPGVYNHEVFGSMDLTSETYEQILDNFNKNTYKQDLPIRATHTPAEAGAVGWIKQGGMRLAEDGSLEVKPEWNELGKGLVEDDRFRYVSAEFCRKWTNPVTQELHENVAVGLALVTRPHFKTDVLDPLSYSEAIAFGEVVDRGIVESTAISDKVQEGTEMSDNQTALTESTTDATQVAANVASVLGDAIKDQGAAKTAQPENLVLADLTQVVLTAEQRKNERQMFADLTTRVELAERRADTAEAEVKRMKNDRRIEKYTAEVTGRSAENGEPWFGDPRENVQHLVNLSEQFGDDSAEVRWAVNQKRNEAKAIRNTGIFDPISIGTAETAKSAETQIAFFAEQYRNADPSLTMEKAITRAYEEHPELYTNGLSK